MQNIDTAATLLNLLFELVGNKFVVCGFQVLDIVGGLVIDGRDRSLKPISRHSPVKTQVRNRGAAGRSALKRTPQQLLTEHPHFLSRALDVDRGWSMEAQLVLPIVLFAFVFTGIARANDHQLQQTCMNAGISLLSVRSGLSPGRH